MPAYKSKYKQLPASALAHDRVCRYLSSNGISQAPELSTAHT